MPSEERSRTNLDARWIARIYGATGGEDFLGLRAVQENMTSQLLPGIITTTSRARYYPFYSWLLVEHTVQKKPGLPLPGFVKRREKIFVLANLAASTASNGPAQGRGLLGSRKLGGHWRTNHESTYIPLSTNDYLEATYGGYSTYAGVMAVLGLAHWDGPNFLGVLPKGQQLAEAFADAIRETEYYARRATFDTAESIPRLVLEEYGSRCHLSALAGSSDATSTLESLFAFDAETTTAPLGGSDSSLGNMKGSLALILDMIDQAEGPFGDEEFREAAAYGACADYSSYRPSNEVEPVLAHWQMFQLREYYVYALYCLWVYFLYWLRLEGPKTFEDFRTHLNDAIDLTIPATALGIALPGKRPYEWSLTGWLDTLLEVSGVTGPHWENRCASFAATSDVPPNEHQLYRLLSRGGPEDPSQYVGTTWLLLSSLFLRLSGIRKSVEEEAWYWARFGGARRRSMALFVADMESHMEARESLLDTWTWLFRDYIVAQHIISALEKWRQRRPRANTFHFNYDRGLFEWVQDGRTGFSGSRFPQAYSMLADLGLYRIVPEENGIPELTDLGLRTLHRVEEALGG